MDDVTPCPHALTMASIAPPPTSIDPSVNPRPHPITSEHRKTSTLRGLNLVQDWIIMLAVPQPTYLDRALQDVHPPLLAPMHVTVLTVPCSGICSTPATSSLFVHNLWPRMTHLTCVMELGSGVVPSRRDTPPVSGRVFNWDPYDTSGIPAACTCPFYILERSPSHPC